MILILSSFMNIKWCTGLHLVFDNYVRNIGSNPWSADTNCTKSKEEFDISECVKFDDMPIAETLVRRIIARKGIVKIDNLLKIFTPSQLVISV